MATADGNDAVIASGLQPGMQVVSAGVHVLSPGQKVTIYQPKVPDVPAPAYSSATNSVASQAASPVPPAPAPGTAAK